MSRTMRTQQPLNALLMHARDERYVTRQQGESRTTLIEGVTQGKAAPPWLTRFFPGLDLVEYSYNRMVGFSTIKADGMVENDLIFSGRQYDLYVEGRTDAQQVGNYTIGVILVSGPQSPDFNHQNRLGRVPLLKWRARIVDGKRVDEEVSYPWPNEAAFDVFVKNNPLIRPLMPAVSGGRAAPPGSSR
jgi:hypothetical protein